MRIAKNKKQRKRKRAKELIVRISNNIRTFRMKIGLTQERLQELSGVLVYRCESGRNDMTLTTINTLSNHLDIEPYELLKKL